MDWHRRSYLHGPVSVRYLPSSAACGLLEGFHQVSTIDAGRLGRALHLVVKFLASVPVVQVLIPEGPQITPISWLAVPRLGGSSA